MINGKFKIIDSTAKIEANIFKSLYDGMKLLLTRAKPKIESQIKNLVREALIKSPEISSLQSGKLKFDFGLDSDPTGQIIESIVNSVHVYFKDFKLSKSGYSNTLNVYIQPSDFNNLLTLSVANQITEKGVELPWLSWLLTAGDAIIITQYHVEYDSVGRSGGAHMIPGGIFKVDSAFSGTIDNNFITRSLEGYEDAISDILRKNI